jgi:hypothetical protein
MAYDSSRPADDETLSVFPAGARENARSLKEDQIVNAGTLKGLSPNNNSGQIPISNGTVNTNLNADMVDGKNASDFATSGHTHSVATTSSAGFESAADKTKLDTIATNAEVNQNAFSNITVGSTTIQADAKQDTLILTAGPNIALTPDATNDKVTIGVTGTVDAAASCTGNSATATALATARTIALSGGATGTATSFNGSANITIPVTSLDVTKLSGTATISTTGNAATATKAIGDSDGNNIKSTYLKQNDASTTYVKQTSANYVKSISSTGTSLTVTAGDGSTSSITTGKVQTVNGASPDSSGNIVIPDIASHATALAKLQSFFNGTATRTLLAGSETGNGIGSGNITLSDSWKNYDALLVIRCGDDLENLSSDLVYTWQFQQLVDLATSLKKNVSLGDGTQGFYWYVQTKSTDTLLVVAAENCAVQAIYGIKMTGTGVTNNTAIDVTELQKNYASLITSDKHLVLPSGLEVW